MVMRTGWQNNISIHQCLELVAERWLPATPHHHLPPHFANDRYYNAFKDMACYLQHCRSLPFPL